MVLEEEKRKENQYGKVLTKLMKKEMQLIKSSEVKMAFTRHISITVVLHCGKVAAWL